MIEELDAFENKWFPIARVSLERHHPEMAAELFLNLSQTEGVEVAVSVRTFLERLAQMQQGVAPFDAGGSEAWKLLQQRGLTEGQAMSLSVNGFVNDLVRQFPMEYSVELKRLIDLEMEGSVG